MCLPCLLAELVLDDLDKSATLPLGVETILLTSLEETDKTHKKTIHIFQSLNHPGSVESTEVKDVLPN